MNCLLLEHSTLKSRGVLYLEYMLKYLSTFKPILERICIPFVIGISLFALKSESKGSDILLAEGDKGNHFVKF